MKISKAFRKKYKKICKYYENAFKVQAKLKKTYIYYNLEYDALCLQYLRDYCLLSYDLTTDKVKAELVSALQLTVQEYMIYLTHLQNCAFAEEAEVRKQEMEEAYKHLAVMQSIIAAHIKEFTLAYE